MITIPELIDLAAPYQIHLKLDTMEDYYEIKLTNGVFSKYEWVSKEELNNNIGAIVLKMKKNLSLITNI